MSSRQYIKDIVFPSGGGSYVVKLIIGLQIIIILTCYFVKNPYLVVFLSFLESMGLIIYFSSKYKKST